MVMTIDPAPATLLCFDGKIVHFCGQIVHFSGQILCFGVKVVQFLWRKTQPKVLSAEKKWQISCMHGCTDSEGLFS